MYVFPNGVLTLFRAGFFFFFSFSFEILFVFMDMRQNLLNIKNI